MQQTIPENMKTASYKILFHIENICTLTETGLFGDTHVCFNEQGNDRIYVLLDDMLDQIADMPLNMTDMPYSLDVLIDNKLVASAEGTIK